MVVLAVAAAGGEGCASIVKPADGSVVQPSARVTVKLCAPVANPLITAVVVLPAMPPGLRVHEPAGKPLTLTLPVAIAQVGWVIVPIVGADGVTG